MELGPLQKKWIELLKSGQYKQTTERLHLCRTYPKVEAKPPEDAYCCLGVACRFVLGQEPALHQSSHHTSVEVFAYNGTLEFMANYAELGLRSMEGSASCAFTQAALVKILPRLLAPCSRIKLAPSLANLNDKYSLTFPEIADVLLAVPEVYFTRSV